MECWSLSSVNDTESSYLYDTGTQHEINEEMCDPFLLVSHLFFPELVFLYMSIQLVQKPSQILAMQSDKNVCHVRMHVDTCPLYVILTSLHKRTTGFVFSLESWSKFFGTILWPINLPQDSHCKCKFIGHKVCILSVCCFVFICMYMCSYSFSCTYMCACTHLCTYSPVCIYVCMCICSLLLPLCACACMYA